MAVITLDNAKQLKELGQTRHGWISHVTWSPDGKVLALASGKGVEMYVNGFGGAPTYTLPHPMPVKSVAFHPTKPMIATGAKDTLVRLWLTPEKSIELRGHGDSVNSVAFLPMGESLVSGSSDKQLIIWNTVAPYEQSASYSKHTNEISGIAVSKSYGIASGSWDKTIYLPLNETLLQHDDLVRQVRFSPRTEILASASKDGTIRLWQLDANGLPTRQALISAHVGGADSIAFSPDETLLATGGRDNIIRLWDVQKLLQTPQTEIHASIASLSGHKKPIMALAFNPAGTLLVSGSGDNTARLWGV